MVCLCSQFYEFHISVEHAQAFTPHVLRKLVHVTVYVLVWHVVIFLIRRLASGNAYFMCISWHFLVNVCNGA